jgi:16S rRNA (cytosine967-C5)-methyltransferase
MAAVAREAALAVVRAVGDGRADLGEALARAKARLTDERDRALAGEIASGVLRHRAAIDYQLAARLTRPIARLDPEVLDILRVSAFQLLHLTRVPAAAVVDDAVSLTRGLRKSSAGGLVNAVLRRLVRERHRLSWPVRPMSVETDADRVRMIEHLAITESHPAWLVARWIDRYGVDHAETWLKFDNRAPALTLVVPPTAGTRESVAAALAAEDVATERTRVAPFGLTVVRGHPLRTEVFRAGRCLVQDEASQLIALLVEARPGATVLDLCAAPGGKTVLLAAAAAPMGYVVASDVRPRRMRLLAATVRRCTASGVGLVQVARDGALPFRVAQFDGVLVDAPCSGLGTVRRDPDIKWRREPNDLALFADQQVDLLRRAAPLVGPGGRLVYSTCSSEPIENEKVVARFLARHPGFRVLPLDRLPTVPATVRALGTPDGYLRTLPFRDGLEAFFGAVLQYAPGPG